MFGPCGGLSRSAAIEEPFNRTTKNKLLLTTKTNYELMQTFYILRIPISFCTINTNFLFSSSPDPFSHVNKKKIEREKKGNSLCNHGNNFFRIIHCMFA